MSMELSSPPSTPPAGNNPAAPPPPSLDPVQGQDPPPAAQDNQAPMAVQPSSQSTITVATEAAATTTTEEVELKKERTKAKRGWLMVIATLVASVAYQAGLNPPGGFWSDDLASSAAGKGHTAGHPILADKEPIRFGIFYSCNVGAFSWAVVIILMLMREAFFHREANLNLLRGCMAIAVVNLTAAFGSGSNRSVTDSVSFFGTVGCCFVYIAVDAWRRGRRQSRGDVESHGVGPQQQPASAA